MEHSTGNRGHREKIKVSTRAEDASNEGDKKSRTTLLAGLYKIGISHEVNDDQPDETGFTSLLTSMAPVVMVRWLCIVGVLL